MKISSFLIKSLGMYSFMENVSLKVNFTNVSKLNKVYS